ncbi:MAG TPA: hypothetical protein VJ914_11050 [Pseudonocardiaceae bacterium]|nr:hypothetical protein [Pseudonocardiaceae bacterium]
MSRNGTRTTATVPPPQRLSYVGDQAVFDGGDLDVGAMEIRALLRGTGLQRRTTKLTVRNAKIVDGLDLESAEITVTAEFQNCRFADRINLEQAKVKALYFDDCRLNGISADQLQTTFSFTAEKCTDTGGIKLTGAHVGGYVSFNGSHLGPSADEVLLADGLVVDQDLECSNGFVAEGLVRLVGAHVSGQFRCENSSFLNPGKLALEASGLLVDQDVYWRHEFRANGSVRLQGAHIEGRLCCEGAHFENADDIALGLNGLVVDQDVSFGSGSNVLGGIDLTGCEIGGKLDLTGGKFRHVGNVALDLARASVSQNMLCRSGFEVWGKVHLVGATINGNLWCEGGRFDNPSDTAIDATGLTLGRDVKFSLLGDNSFLANGKIVLNDASIGGSLDCTGGRLNNSGGYTLTAKGLNVTRDALFGTGFITDGEVDLSDSTVGGCLNANGGWFGHQPMSLSGDRMRVRQSAKLGAGFYAKGTVSLRDAQVTANLEFDNATLDVQNPAATALVLTGASVGGALRMRFVPQPVAAIDLCRAKVGQLDDRETTWPPVVWLDGFVYSTLPTDGPTVQTRLDWLAHSPRYVPQIYLQLASVYLAAGSNKESTAVSIAGEDKRRTSQTGPAGWFKRALGLLLKVTVQYGYRPLYILWWIFGLEAVGAAVFFWLHDIGAFTPTNPPVPAFNSVLYTLDLLVPVFSLGQRAYWIPNPAAAWVAGAFTVVGWVLATCLVLGVGKIFKN